MVRHFIGDAIQSLLDAEVEAGALCYLDVCDMNLDIWKQLIYHKNKWLSKSLKAMIDYIKAKDFT